MGALAAPEVEAEAREEVKSTFERLKEMTEKYPGRGLYMHVDGSPNVRELVLGFDEIIRLWRLVEVVKESGVCDDHDPVDGAKRVEIRAWLDAVTKVRT